MENSRIFASKNKSGQEVTLKFVRPTQSVLSKADLKSREAFSKAFRNGLLTNAEVLKFLKERGIWTEDMEMEANGLRIKVKELSDKLNDPSLSNEEGYKIVEEIKELRAKINEYSGNIRSIADNTCEAVASETRNQFIAANCVVNATTGVKIFKDLDDFLARLDEIQTIDSYREAVISNLESETGIELTSDLTAHYPENKWLKERKANIEKQLEVVEEVKTEVKAAEEEKPSKKKSK